jgi:O-antigen/teichoic acid export membrane protein
MIEPGDDDRTPSDVSLPRSVHLARLIGRKTAQHATAIIALAVRAAAVLAGFAVTFLIGNQLGAAANGQFALVSQTAAFLAVVGLLGLDVSVVRHFAKAAATKARIALAAFWQVTGLGLGLMVVIAAVLWLGGDFIWSALFGDAVPRAMLLVLCILLVGRGGTQLLGGLLRSQHRFTLGQIIAALTIPATTAIALISGAATSVEDALWAAAFGGLGSILIGAIVMQRHVGRGPEALTIPLRPVLASSLPLWGVGIALNIGEWYGLTVAAQMLGAEDAGLYRVAVQIAATLQIISIALFSIYSAKISTAFHAGDTRQVALLARSAVRVSTAASLPLVIALVVGSEFLLGQIGTEFLPALPLVFILIAGQLAQTLTGPCGLVLAMSGNERTNLAITVSSTVLLLLSVPVAAYFAGLAGIAACISVLMLLRNILAYVVVRRKLGISIWAGTVRPVDEETTA